MDTNIVNKDPDTKFDPLLRITKTTKKDIQYKFQSIYAFLLYHLLILQ